MIVYMWMHLNEHEYESIGMDLDEYRSTTDHWKPYSSGTLELDYNGFQWVVIDLHSFKSIHIDSHSHSVRFIHIYAIISSQTDSSERLYH